MSNQRISKLESRRSCHIGSTANSTHSKWKSDICLSNGKASYTVVKSPTGSNIPDGHRHKEYYKRYEHDELPVKDSTNKCKIGKSFTIKDHTKSITDSDLDRLERSLYQNISQDLHNETSTSSLESNIKFLKATIQEIFNTFQNNLRDYDVYKQKLNELLSKTQTDSIIDMENFIKEMIHNIISSESSDQSLLTADNMVQVDRTLIEVQDGETCTMQDHISKTDTLDSRKTFGTSYDDSVHLVVEAYKNDNYLTDSTANDNGSKMKNHTVDNRVNVYLLSNSPCIIKMNNRSLLSEINIKGTNLEGASSYIASTENIKKLAAKRIEIERYEMQPPDMADREIPVKVSFAKKNLCSSEDHVEVQEPLPEECNKSLISKICNFICKKLRRNSIA